MVPKLRSFVLFALVVFVALACSSDHRVHCRFDADVTPQERALFTSQMASWNEVTTSDFAIDVDDRGDERVTFTTDIPSNGVQQDGRECTYDGKDCRVAHWIRVRRGMSDDHTRDVSRHEMGHSLGMHHLEPSHVGTMHPTNIAPTITKDDKSLCLEDGACPSISMSAVSNDETSFGSNGD